MLLLVNQLCAPGATETAVFFEDLMYGAFSSLTAILMTHFLVDLQEAASVSVHFGTQLHSESSDASSSISVLRFVRADVDNWIEDELQRLSVLDGGGTPQPSQDHEFTTMMESVGGEADLDGAYLQKRTCES